MPAFVPTPLSQSIQAGTTGDVVSIAVLNPDGTVPDFTTAASVSIVVQDPLRNSVSYIAAIFAKNNVQMPTVPTMFSNYGSYRMQAVITMPNGAVIKSTVVTLTVFESLA